MRKNRFPRAARLLRSVDFKRTRRKGQRVESKSFILYRLPNGLREARLGFSVSARVGNAVARNRIKRFLREFFRLRREQLKPEDFFIVVKNGKLPKTFAEVEAELRSTFDNN